ncbi:rhomboid family intramembrane serine protease [Crocinitomicaceae bacterium]|nr:rhomboid family intramembrane serine protease [Crocinitomicaceae bacterium]
MNSTTTKTKVIWTYIIGAFVLLAYIGMSYQSSTLEIPDSILVKYGAPYAIDIYDGQFWGVIANSFLQNNFTLFICNILFFVFIGRIVEKKNGTWFLLFFGLGSSIITSCAELAFSGDPGVGLTGVNFGLLGYILLSKKIVWKNPWLRASPWFFVGVVLFLCAEQIIQNDYKIAVFSILSGLVFGIVVALTQGIKWIFYFTQALFFSVSFVSLLYNPYSSEWHTFKGYRHIKEGKIKEAKIHYKKALKISPDNVAAQYNLKLIRIESLINKAYELHLNKDYTSARNVYIQILKIDETNKWAKENLAELP